MQNCERVTRSGAVLEKEYYPVSENIRNIGRSKPEPENVRTPEEKARYNRYKSEKHFVRLINTNFRSGDYYVTLTYNDGHLPESYEEAQKNIDNYIRRLRYSNPNAKIVAVTGHGKSTGRLHHHLIISGVSESDIISKWTFGSIIKAEPLREHNEYNGIDHGEDFTALAVYMHKHTPEEYKGKRWKQTKNILQPIAEKPKKVRRVYSPDHPPKAPQGYMLVEARKSEFYKSGYVYFKYVRIPQEQLDIQPIFQDHRAGAAARL